MTAEEIESRIEKLRTYDYSYGRGDSFFSRVWSDLSDAAYRTNFTFRGIGGSLAGMRRATSLVEKVAGIAERNAEELKLPKSRGVSSLLQYWKTCYGYRRDMRQLKKCTTELYDLIDREFEAAFPHESSTVFDYIDEIEKAIKSSAKKEKSAAKGEEKKEEEKREKDESAKTEQQAPPQPTETGKSEESAGTTEETQASSSDSSAQPVQPAASPAPAPKPPRRPDDPKDDVPISPKGQIKASKILQSFTHSLANIEVNINVNISIFANESGKVTWTESEAAELKDKARLALQDFIGGGSSRQTVDLSPQSMSSVADMSADRITNKLRAEKFLKGKTPVFGNPAKMTKEEKRRQDFRVMRMIRDSEHGGNAMSTVGIEEAARRAYERKWLCCYSNARSAASAYGAQLHNSDEQAWSKFVEYTEEERNELVAMMRE